MNLLLNSTKIYEPKEIQQFLFQSIGKPSLKVINKKVNYYEIPMAFDIETTSFYYHKGKIVLNQIDPENDEKGACMYGWTFGINGLVMLGRTWEEFDKVLQELQRYLFLNFTRRVIIYVHNLAYEFQFFRKRFKWEKIFSLEKRKPIYCITTNGIEFRCSYLLSGYGLQKLGDNLQKYKCEKKVGDLDYNKLRHCKTVLTDKEKGYMVNDVKVVMCYVKELFENNKGVYNIPITKTGFVRNRCRNNCLYDTKMSKFSSQKKGEKYRKYREIMSSLTLTPEEYVILKRGFAGGFTHCNAWYNGITMYDVDSFDFTSSYTTTMLCELFPMSKGKFVYPKDKEELYGYLKHYCCIFDIEFKDLDSKVDFEHYISISHCDIKEKVVVDNGRVVRAERLSTTITEQDFAIILRMYKFSQIKISNMIVYERGYLPKDFVKSILELYGIKTTLKDVVDMAAEYLRGKEDLNAAYGMTVTDICREDIMYSDDDEWSAEEPDINKVIKKYNSSRSRFLFYPWGVWVTAYARRNLFSGILEFKDDYIYSDTDSIKVINSKNHMDYINGYNENIRKKLYDAMDYHGIDRNEVEPKTKDGVKKLTGVWDYDNHYKRFKTLGAKRYMYEKDDGKINITVAGLNKKKTVPYLIQQQPYKHLSMQQIFDSFDDGLFIPEGYTGKNIHTYIDYECSGVMTDYNGVKCRISELSSIHLSATSYELSLAEEYANYLLTINESVDTE